MRYRLPIRRALVLALALAAACSDSTAPTPAGIYTLAMVTGRGPASGSFILSADGHAERRVRYATTQDEIIYVGGFSVNGGKINFNLVPSGRFGDFPWPVSGQWLGSQFTITYPDPADGPDIVERYRRQ